MARRQDGKLHAPGGEKRIGGNEERVGVIAYKRCEGSINLVAIVRVQDLDLQSEGARGLWYVAERGLGSRGIGRIDQHGNANGLGHQLMQKPQPLGHNFTLEIIDPRRVATRPRQTRNKTELDWVFGDTEHYWDGRGRSFRGERSGSAAQRDNSAHMTTD